MPTRCFVASKSLRFYSATYVHYDGEPDNMTGILKQHFNSTSKVRKLLNSGLLKAIEKDGTVKVLDESKGPFVTQKMDKLIDIAKSYWAVYLYLYEPARFGWYVCPLLTSEQYKEQGSKPKWNDIPELL